VSVISKKIARELSDFIRVTGKVIAEIKVTSWAENGKDGAVNLYQSVNVRCGDVSVSATPPADRVPARVERVG
jgi:hypothetical protein